MAEAAKDAPPDFDAGTQSEPEEEELKPGALGSLYRFLRPYFRPYNRRLLALGSLLLVQTLFNASFPLATQHLIDKGLIERDWDAMVLVLAFLGVAAVTVSLISIANDYLYAGVAADVVKDIRVSLFEHVQTLPMPFFQRTPSGKILSRFSGDVVAAETMLAHLVPALALPLLEVIYSTLLMFYFNAWLGLIGLAVFPMIPFGPRLFSRRAFDVSYEKRLREADLLSFAQENVQAQSVVKAFGLRGTMGDRFRRDNSEWRRFAFRMNFFSALAESSAHMGVYVIHIVILGLGAYWAYNDVISVGTLVAFEAMFVSMGYALTDLTQFVPTLAQAAGSVSHLDEIFSTPPATADRPQSVAVRRMAQALTAEDVSFTYPDGHAALSHVSFSVPKNSYLCIVGRSGSGKSTLLSLLLRFYEPTSGRLAIDDVDVLDAQQESLRAQIGVVFQDSLLFNASVLANVRMGSRDATLADVEAALRGAEVWDFVQSLPRGLDTSIGERGGNLSGGQRQRLAIARALVRDPSILIFDEATSALDAVSEAAINATLKRLAHTRTIINVTHRLGNVVDAGNILVMRDGRIVESGTHRALVAAGGYYAALWHAQQKNYQRPDGV